MQEIRKPRDKEIMKRRKRVSTGLNAPTTKIKLKLGQHKSKSHSVYTVGTIVTGSNKNWTNSLNSLTCCVQHLLVSRNHAFTKATHRATNQPVAHMRLFPVSRRKLCLHEGSERSLGRAYLPPKAE